MARSINRWFVALVVVIMAQPCWGVALRSHVTIRGPMIVVGDVFTGLESLQDEPVIPAPAPGTKIEYRAAWADALAKRYGIAWTPPRADDTITLERSAHFLGVSDIRAHLQDALLRVADTSFNPQAELILDRENLRIAVPEASDSWNLQVDDLQVTDNRFRAHIVIHEKKSLQTYRTAISGTWVAMVDVPVLARAVKPGDILTDDSFITRKMRHDRIRADAVTDVTTVIGKTPAHRTLASGDMVRADDVKLPTIIQRNAIVTMVVETPHMTVSARGRALNDAAAGEETRVTNLDSQKVVSGVAIRPGVVALAPYGSF